MTVRHQMRPYRRAHPFAADLLELAVVLACAVWYQVALPARPSLYERVVDGVLWAIVGVYCARLTRGIRTGWR